MADNTDRVVRLPISKDECQDLAEKFGAFRDTLSLEQRNVMDVAGAAMKVQTSMMFDHLDELDAVYDEIDLPRLPDGGETAIVSIIILTIRVKC